MKVALVGHGKMGREVEAVLRERGHEPVVVARGDAFPAGCPVGIDFTRAGRGARRTSRAALAAGARYVVGTTGWHDAAARTCARWSSDAGGGLVHAANFSARREPLLPDRARRRGPARPLPRLRPLRPREPPPAEEGRALGHGPGAGRASSSRAQAARAQAGRRASTGALPDDAFHVASVRAGGIVGEHTVGFDSGGDEILLEHRARIRRGFALGRRPGRRVDRDPHRLPRRSRPCSTTSPDVPRSRSAPRKHDVDLQRKHDSVVVRAASKGPLEVLDERRARLGGHRPERPGEG